MILFRLSKRSYINDLSGNGAKITGGRWNSKGVTMLYTSSSRALCTTEVAVHNPLGIVPSDYWIATLEVPDTIDVLELPLSAIPNDWNLFPHPHSTQAIGDNFIASGKYLIMKVPSAVVPGDFNYLINPGQTKFSEVKIIATEPFNFDERLFIR